MHSTAEHLTGTFPERKGSSRKAATVVRSVYVSQMNKPFHECDFLMSRILQVTPPRKRWSPCAVYFSAAGVRPAAAAECTGKSTAACVLSRRTCAKRPCSHQRGGTIVKGFVGDNFCGFNQQPQQVLHWRLREQGRQRHSRQKGVADNTDGHSHV
jgi:hypothetical protein